MQSFSKQIERNIAESQENFYLEMGQSTESSMIFTASALEFGERRRCISAAAALCRRESETRRQFL